MTSLFAADARDKLIVALDFPTVGAAEALVWQLGDAVTFYKIGLELTISGGLDLASDLIDAGKKVFLDLKLHD
ncbi:MAG: orotidine 5'-phosphate decarboxylase, partial [Rhizobiales bacterium 32-66-8]